MASDAGVWTVERRCKVEKQKRRNEKKMSKFIHIKKCPNLHLFLVRL